MTTAVLILAAGASARMGQPKPLLPWQDKTLLEHIVAVAAALEQPVFVVAGELVAAITPLVRPYGAKLLHNPNWRAGMGTSIATGLDAILQTRTSPDALLLLACDQPFVSTGLLQTMIDTQANTGKGIIACAYGNTQGIPVLFGRQYFPALQALHGPAGAKKILQENTTDCTTVSFPQGEWDIDTPERYERLKNLKI